MIPAMSRAVPVAESQLKVQIAPSGVGLGTTGGAFRTRLWSQERGLTWSTWESLPSAPPFRTP